MSVSTVEASFTSEDLKSQESKLPEPINRIDYTDEVSVIFLNSVLDLIVESWTPLILDDDVESIPSRTKIITSKSYHEIQSDDFSNQTVTGVDGSNVNLSKTTTSNMTFLRGQGSKRSSDELDKFPLCPAACFNSGKKSVCQAPCHNMKRKSLLHTSSDNLQKKSICPAACTNLERNKSFCHASCDSLKKKSSCTAPCSEHDNLGTKSICPAACYNLDKNTSFCRAPCADKRSLDGKSKMSFRSRKSKRKLNRSKMTIEETGSKVSEETFELLEPQKETAIIKFRNGNAYEGKMFKKLMHGTGTFTWANGTTYTGEFVNGMICGNGHMTYTDLSWYKGEFYNGYRHGKGSMFIAESGKTYSGSWRYGVKHGEGWILYEPGNWYKGMWKNGAKDGYGLRQYRSGARYLGYWKSDSPHGKGCMVWKNNDYYNGDWVCGVRNGYGEYGWNKFLHKTFSFPTENVYKGAWSNGCMHGVGLMDFGMDGGARLAGCWENNMKHGPGILLCENGKMIQSNPLFINDKPLHSDEVHEHEVDLFHKIYSSRNSSQHGTQMYLSTLGENSLVSIAENKSSTLKMISEQIENRQSLTKLDQPILDNIEKCKDKFVFIKTNYENLDLPIQIPDEQIPLTYYINKVLARYEGLRTDQIYSPSKKTLDGTNRSMYYSMRTYDSPASLKRLDDSVKISCTGLQNIYMNEEKTLTNEMKKHLPRLRMIYHQYTLIGCLKTLKFKPLMIRMFLWQLYRDCQIVEKEISLAEIDVALAENHDSVVCSTHDPFEKIYFWQFLHSLITLSWLLYGEECIYCTDGILKEAFLRLLIYDIYPNHGHHTGSVLFEYLDYFPMKSAHDWYKKQFGEPHTVIKFLQELFKPQSYDFNCNYPTLVKSGTNTVFMSQKVFYLRDEALKNEWEPEQLLYMENNPHYFYQCIKKELSTKKVLKFLCEICPGIKSNGLIVNMEYKLVFLEFYETILICVQKIINIRAARMRVQLILKSAETLRSSIVKFSSKSVKSHIQFKKSKHSSIISKRKMS